MNTVDKIPSAMTLTDVVDKFFMAKRINSKKHYPSYLADALRIWKDSFQKTLWSTSSRWVEVKVGADGKSYIDIPKCAVRVFSINTVDECNRLVPLVYDNKANIESVPIKELPCGCSGVSEMVDNFVFTTKVMFTINGIDYLQKKWAKYCDDGCIIEYTETPVRKYKDRKGDSGDFNEDYNDDYKIGAGSFSNYEIVYIQDRKKVCELEKEDCGCPKNTEENKQKVIDHCLCYMNVCSKNKCKIDCNESEYGAIKKDGNRYFILKGKKDLPDFLNISYQVSGDNPGADILIPDYAENLMMYGLDYYSKRFNNSVSRFDVREAKAEYENEQIEIIRYLNPISLRMWDDVKHVANKW